MLIPFDLGLEPRDQVAREAPHPGNVFPSFFCAGRNQDHVSKNFERWKELATLTSKEQDPARLTELANEMNRVLTQKTPYLDPPLHAPAAGSHEESQFGDVLKANAEGKSKVCFT